MRALPLLTLVALLAGCPRTQPDATPSDPTAQVGDHGDGSAAHADNHGDAPGAPAGGHADGHGAPAEGHHEGAVTFSAAAQKAQGVHVVSVARRAVDRRLETTGEIAENTDAEAHVTPRVAGRVLAVRKTVGDWVRAGETLVQLESEALGQAQATFLEAQARHDLAIQTLARQRTLQRGELTARKEVLAAEHEARLGAIALEAARNRLRLMGTTEARMTQLATRRRLDARVDVPAPIAGLIVQKHVTLGEMVEPTETQPAYVISDPSTLWVGANLYERDLGRVKPGQQAIVTTPAYPGKVYYGRVSLISTTLDKDTRTARARVAVANADRALKPGMFASIGLVVGRELALVVPVSAVLLDRQQAFVFVLAAPERFERREVTLDPPVGGVHVVRAGLKGGEQVVAAGAFMLKSELMKEGFGGHAH